MSWTEEKDAMLKRLWQDGRSASDCADEIGTAFGETVSRNAVLSRLHRKGMAARHVAPKPRKPRPPRPSQRKAPVVQPSPILQPIFAKSTAPVQEEIAIPVSARITLDELRETTCRWPIGDPHSDEFCFCGALKPANGKPYCGPHSRLAAERPAKAPARAHTEEANLKRRLAMLKKGTHGFQRHSA